MSQTKVKEYQPLTEETAVNLVLSLNLFDHAANLTCQEIGDGNLNLVFHIVDQNNGKSIIIKQALPYAKVVGESWPLTLNRAKIEANALQLFGQIAPDYVPKVYYSDEALAVTVMEDLSRLTISRTGFINGETYPLISKHLGEFLGKSLFYTSDYGLGPAAKKGLVQQFINPELCKITEDLIFTDPYYDAETNDYELELRPSVEVLWQDDELKHDVTILKRSFLTEAEVLLHGDLHTGSIFASNSETKIIDPEFAFYGPAGFDIGQVFANIIFQVIVNSGKRNVFLNHIEIVWDTFKQQYSQLWHSENKEKLAATEGFLQENLAKFFEDAVGFAGCELIRRTIGLAHVADLDHIEDLNRRIKSKQTALEIGTQLIKQRKGINNIGTLCTTINEVI